MKPLLLKGAPITAFNLRLSIFANSGLKKLRILLSTLFLVIFSVQSFSQIDTTPPFVDFGSEFTIELDENGRAIVTVDAVGGDEFDDNGEPLTFAFSQTDFDCSDMAAPIEVTITVTNAAGISASTVMNAMVEDNMGPILVTNDLVIQLDADGNGTYTVEDVFSAETRDNCGGVIDFQIGGSPTVNRDDVANSPFRRVVKGEDQSGNITRTRVTITVLDFVDTTPPTVSTKNITAELGSDGTVTIAATDIDNGSIDNESTDLTYAISQSQFVCIDFGNAVNVTLTVTDEAGNSASANATVTVTGTDTDSDGYADACDLDDDNDGILDTIECSSAAFFWSGPVTLDYTSGRTPKPFAYGTINGIRYFYSSNVDFSTTSNLFGVSKFPTEFGIPNQTSIRNDLASQNTLTFTQPMTNPVLVFASIGGGSTVNIDFQNDFEVLWIESGTTSVNGRRVTGKEGNIVIRFNGTFSTLSFDYLNAETYANFAFGADFYSLCDFDEDGITNDLDPDSDNDGCSDAVEGALGFALDQTSNDRLIGAVDTNGVPILANGGQGVGTSANASVSCFFDLELDKIAPTLAGVPIDVTVACNIVLTVPTVTATDNHSANPTVTFNEERIDGISNDNYTLTRTWTATDESGNTASGIQVITVEDNIAPTLVGIPADVSVEFNTVPAVATVSATDDCTNPLVIFREERVDGISNNNYTLTRTWTATDDSGNTVSGTQVITVRDATPPAVITKDKTVYLDANGNATITPQDIDAGSSDDSGSVILSLNQTTFDCNDFSVSCSGSSIEFNGTGIASGANGDNIQNLGLNQLTMEAWVKPNGGTVNSIIRKAGDYDLYIVNNTLYAEVWYEGRASSAQYLYSGPSVPDNGWSHLAFTFDKSNSGSGKFYVNGIETVVSGAARSITPDITLGIGGSTEFGQSFTGLIDDVRIWSTERTNAEINEFKDFCIDANSVGLEAYFKIEANEGTTLTDYSGNGNHLTIEGTSWSTEGAPIKSQGTEVILTVTDAANNASFGVANVIVLDNISPTINLNGDAIVFHDAYTEYSDLGAIATDNCIAEVVTDNPVDANTPGAYMVNYTATDASGNEATATRTVIVRDITSPTVSIQSTTASLDANGIASITTNDVVASSSDDSGVVNVSSIDTDFACDDLGDNTVLINAEDGNGNGLAISQDGLVGYWKFFGATPLKDLTGNWGDIETIGNASLNNGTLDLNANGFARTSGYSGNTITSKTLISYVTLEDLDVRSGAAISIDGVTTDNFDAIVYAERQVRRWMNGSSFFRRTQDLNPGFAETQTNQLIQMAITYENVGGQVIVSVYRSGVNIGSYTSANASSWTPGNMEILFGARHTAGNTQFGSMDARISKALLYNRALSAQEIAAMNGIPVTVSVVDQIAPVITASADISVNATSASGAVVNYTTPVGTDNCSVTTALTAGLADGATFPIGNTVVTYTATDGSGNAASASFNVEVSGLAPQIIVPANITVSNDAGVCGAIVSYVATETVGIPASVITYSIAPGSGFEIGATTVTATATNAVGESTSTFTVTVEDNEAPIVVTQDVTIELDDQGNAIVTIGNIDNGSNDACGIASMVVSQTTFDCANLGDNTVILTVTDKNGNISSKTAVVTVKDVIAPIVTAENISIALDATGHASIFVGDFFGEMTAEEIAALEKNYEEVGAESADVEGEEDVEEDFEVPGAGSTYNNFYELIVELSDNCGIVSVVADKTDFDCSNVGDNTVTITVTDGSGNATVVQANVLVNDVTSPTVIPKNITVALDENGAYTITPGDVNDGTFDNCDFTLSLDNTSFDCSTLGANTVMLTATDASNNSTTLAATVTVIDNAGPVITTNSITVELDEIGNASITLDQVNSGTTDNCAVATVMIDITSFTCDNLGDNTVTITATDVNGNVSTAAVNVEVVDRIAPIVSTQDISVDLDANGNVNITPEDVLILSPGDVVTGEDCIVSAAESHAVWLSNYVQSANKDVSAHRWGWKPKKKKATSKDTRFVFGAGSGNIHKNLDGTATVTGTIVSTEDVTDSWIVTLNLAGGYNWSEWSGMGRSYKDEKRLAGSSYTDWTYYEMAEGSNLTGTGRNAGEVIGLTHAPTNYRYGFQVGDAANSKNGNFGMSGWFFYTNRAGKMVQGDFNLDVTECNASLPPEEVVITSDNCSIASTSLDISSFSCGNLGENIVNVTVTDGSGNATTVPVTVTVNDPIGPTAVAQDITVSLGANGTVTVDPQLVDGGSTDNCGIVSWALDKDTFDCDDIKNHSNGKGKGHYSYKGKGKGHQKDRGHKVTLTVTDAAGNTDTATAYITVVDDVAPVISSEPITLVVYGRKKAYLTKRDVAQAVTDNCGVKYISFPRKRYDRRHAGENTVMVNAVDYSGNQTTGAVNVNVVDISNYGKYVTMCYEGKTRRVKQKQVQNYLRKGAVLGSCNSAISSIETEDDVIVEDDTPNFVPEIRLTNYPNPTAGYTVFTFSSDVDGPARLVVMNTNGVQLATLFNDELVANEEVEVGYEAGALPSGIYIVRLVTGGTIKNIKLMVKK